MKLNHLTPMLYTADLQGTVDFYVEILGFTCIAFEAEWGWGRVRLDGVELMFSQPNEHIPFEKPGLTGSLYIHTDDVDAIWNRLKDKTTVCYPIEDFDYGMREFAIYDHNGYLLQFGHDL